MINALNLRNFADRNSGFNATVKELESRMRELAEKGDYYIEYYDTDVHIISRLLHYFKRGDFEVEQLSSTRIRVYWW